MTGLIRCAATEFMTLSLSYSIAVQGILNWKYRGEMALRGSGLPFAIVRATGAPSTDIHTILWLGLQRAVIPDQRSPPLKGIALPDGHMIVLEKESICVYSGTLLGPASGPGSRLPCCSICRPLWLDWSYDSLCSVWMATAIIASWMHIPVTGAPFVKPPERPLSSRCSGVWLSSLDAEEGCQHPNKRRRLGFCQEE